MKFLKFHKKFHFRGQNTQNPREGYCVYPIIKKTQLSLETKYQNSSENFDLLYCFFERYGNPVHPFSE